ncbi:MAG: hypothetical protein AAFP97_13420 [Pseudomonadota bacterium]
MFGAFRSPGGIPFFWRLFLCVTVLFSVFGFLVFPPAIGSYVDFVRTAILVEDDPSNMGLFWGAFGKFGLIWTAFILGYVVVEALLRAAFFRGYFFGETEAQIPIQFGEDELRQGFAILGFIGLIFAASIAAIIALIILMVITFAIFGENAIGLTLLLVVVFYIGFFALFIWVGIRFCCAGALTAL